MTPYHKIQTFSASPARGLQSADRTVPEAVQTLPGLLIRGGLSFTASLGRGAGPCGVVRTSAGLALRSVLACAKEGANRLPFSANTVRLAKTSAFSKSNFQPVTQNIDLHRADRPKMSVTGHSQNRNETFFKKILEAQL